MSNKETRRDFILMIAAYVETDQLDKAEAAIIEKAPALGTRKPRWKESITTFQVNRKDWPDSQRWAILQWTVTAGYVNL